MIVPEFNMYFVPELLQAVQDTISKAGYSLIILHTNNEYEKEVNAVLHCLSWVVDGVLAILTEQTTDLIHFQPLHDAQTPVVIMDKIIPTQSYSVVRIDDFKTSSEAAIKLLSHAPRHCIGIFAKPNLEITKNRLNGFLNTVRDYSKAGEFAPLCNILILENTRECENRLKIYAEKYGIPDGIFTMTDELMVAAYRQYLLWSDVSSGDIRFISISDGKAPYHYLKRVSHILHSGYEIGKTATIHLLGRIRSDETGPKELFIETRFIQLDT